jgi:hypothetical protein
MLAWGGRVERENGGISSEEKAVKGKALFAFGVQVNQKKIRSVYMVVRE